MDEAESEMMQGGECNNGILGGVYLDKQKKQKPNMKTMVQYKTKKKLGTDGYIIPLGESHHRRHQRGQPC